MKNVKRFLICVLSVLVTMGTCMVYGAEVSIPYEKEGSALFKVTSPITDLKVGDTAYIRIEASGLSHPYGYELSLSFDENYLTYRKAECGINGDYVSAESTEKDNVKLAFSKKTDSADIGKSLATVEFSVKKSGSSIVTLTDAIIINDGMDYNYYNDLNISVSVSVPVKTIASSGGSSGGGGFGGGFSVGGGNTVSGLSPTVAPADLTVPTDEPEIFSDLYEADWAESSIFGLYELNIISGYEDGSFKPNNNISRAEFCKILMSMVKAELEADSEELTFTDVVKNEWYAPYILAASKLGIVNGYEDGSFLPNASITRQESAAMVCRSAEMLGLNLNLVRLNINFEDEADISEYAVGYVDMMYTAGIINGDENRCFRPLDNISRAETAKMIWEYYNVIENKQTVENEATEEYETVLGEKMVLVESEITDEPEQSAEPEEQPTVEPEPIESDDPIEPTEEPAATFEPDVIYECESLAELYSYNNVYAYLIPNDGSRDAFYDDFTTFQRPGGGDAEIVYSIPYAEEAEVIAYFFAGEELADLKFQTSTDSEYWAEADFACDYLAAEGKWTKATYRLSDMENTKYLKIIFPETINSWTPLIAQVSAKIGESVPDGIEIEGSSELIIPRYDYTDYVYTAKIVDNIGEKLDGEITYSISDSDFEGVSVSENGTVRIENTFPSGGKFILKAESPEFDFSDQIEVTLKSAVIGDMNSDGIIDNADLDAVLRCYDKNSADSEWIKYRDADINGDEIVNIIDIAYVAKLSSFE